MPDYTAVHQEDEEVVSEEMKVLQKVPRCMFKEGEFQKNNGVDTAVQPVIPLMFYATLWMIFSQIVCFFGVKFTATCSAHGQATYPTWLLGLLTLIGSIRSALEWKCLKEYLAWYIPKAVEKKVEPFKLMGKTVPADTWLGIFLCFSFANFGDTGTDSGFAAITSTSLNCPDQQLSTIWEQTMAQSIFGKLPFDIDLSVLVLGFWVLSFIQMVYPIIQYAGKPDAESPDDRWSTYLQKYGCDTRTYIEASEPYGALAEASGMASIQGLAISQRSLDMDGYQAWGLMQNCVVPLAKQVLSRVVLSYVLENAVQLNLQSSLFAMNAYVAKKKMTSSQYQALFSIGMGICTSLLKVLEVKAFFDFIEHEEIKEAKKHARVIALGFDKTLARLIWAIRFASLILVVSLFYGMIKLAAAFICKDSMFNVTGCVELNM